MLTPEEVVTRWVEAYVEGRGEDLVAIAHEEIVLRPRRGQGAPEYRGLEGVRSWYAIVGDPPPPFRLAEVAVLRDGRVMAVGEIHEVSVVAVFEVRDGRVRSVASYTSDRQLLSQVGII